MSRFSTVKYYFLLSCIILFVRKSLWAVHTKGARSCALLLRGWAGSTNYLEFFNMRDLSLLPLLFNLFIPLLTYSIIYFYLYWLTMLIVYFRLWCPTTSIIFLLKVLLLWPLEVFSVFQLYLSVSLWHTPNHVGLLGKCGWTCFIPVCHFLALQDVPGLSHLVSPASVLESVLPPRIPSSSYCRSC